MLESSFLPVDDPLGEHQIFWATIFMVLISSEEARNRMRLKNISQRLDGDLGWYLWLQGQPGAYSLEVGEAISGAAPGENSSRCWIKYYPALTDDPAFQGLSSCEKTMRASRLFDETGTPAFEAAASILREAFVVGYLDLRLTKTHATLCLLAQDLWQVVEKKAADSAKAQASKPSADRCLPGWELAWPVGNALIMAWCMFFVCRPLAAALTQGPGEFWEHSGGENRAVCSSERLRRELFCLLPRPEGQGGLDAFGGVEEWLAEQSVGQELVWMLLQPPDEDLPWANADWWQVSQALGDVGLCCLADNAV